MFLQWTRVPKRIVEHPQFDQVPAVRSEPMWMKCTLGEVGARAGVPSALPKCWQGEGCRRRHPGPSQEGSGNKEEGGQSGMRAGLRSHTVQPLETGLIHFIKSWEGCLCLNIIPCTSDQLFPRTFQSSLQIQWSLFRLEHGLLLPSFGDTPGQQVTWGPLK